MTAAKVFSNIFTSGYRCLSAHQKAFTMNSFRPKRTRTPGLRTYLLNYSQSLESK